MRIKGSDSNSSGYGGGGGSRSDSFKQGRRPGQKIRGTIIKWISDDKAWVLIDGHKLLAQLHSKPPVGAKLSFIIKQLHPNIILKEIFEATSAGASALGLVSSFDTSRTLFENQLRGNADFLDKTPSDKRMKNFLELLTSDNKLLSTFLDATACIQNINQHIDSTKDGILFYLPWMVPAGRRHITLLRQKTTTTDSSPLTQSVTEFELGQFGMVRAEFLYKQPDTSYRLKLQHTAKEDELRKYLASRTHPNLLQDAEFLGISKLPQSGHGGILAELMFKQ